MNGKGVLLYSNILIYISQNLLNFDSLIEQYEYFYCSIISYMDLCVLILQTQMKKMLLNAYLGLA